MSWRGHLARLFVCAILAALDALLRRLAVEIDAAGALLSPGGGVAPEAFVAALGYLATRLALVAMLCATAGRFAADVVSQLLPGARPRGARRRAVT